MLENGGEKKEIHTCMHDTEFQEIIIPVNIAQRVKPNEMCGKRVCGLETSVREGQGYWVNVCAQSEKRK